MFTKPFGCINTRALWTIVVLCFAHLQPGHAAEPAVDIKAIEACVANINTSATVVTSEKELAGTDYPSLLKYYNDKSYIKIKAEIGLSHKVRIETIYYKDQIPVLVIHEDKHYLRDKNTLEFNTSVFSEIETTKYYFVDGKPRYATNPNEVGKSAQEIDSELAKKLELETKEFLKYALSKDAAVSIE